jgi:hypothetical protein
MILLLTRAGDHDLLAPDNDDLLSIQQLLGDNGRQAAEKVALSINNNSIRHY